MHRYGWIVVAFGCIAVFNKKALCIMGIAFILFSVWSFVGYKCKWRHIYCSYQNAYHQEMTPYTIRWHKIKKSDAYGMPIIFTILGIALLLVEIIN